MISKGRLPTKINSYLTVNGVRSTIHLMHSSYYQITIIQSVTNNDNNNSSFFSNQCFNYGMTIDNIA